MSDMPFLYALSLSALATTAFGYQLYERKKLRSRIRFLEQLIPIVGSRQPRDSSGRYIPTAKTQSEAIKKARLNESLRRFRAQHTHEQMEKRLND